MQKIGEVGRGASLTGPAPDPYNDTGALATLTCLDHEGERA